MRQCNRPVSGTRPKGALARLPGIWIVLFGIIILAVPIKAFAEFEKPPVLKAASILKPGTLQGPHHKVDTAVKNDGLFNHYTVKSDFGDFTAISTLTLEARIHEINAIAEMIKVKTEDTIGKSFGDSAGKTVEGVKHLFQDPKGTLEGAGQGIGSLFNRAKETIGKRELTGAEDNRVEQIVGISKSKGKIATKFGVNVYSRNKRLQQELDRLARADWLGGLGTAVAKTFIPGVGGLLLTTSDAARLLNETINTTPAAELWLQNKNKLLSMGFNANTVQLFLNNPSFSPAQHTVMVAALGELEGVANRELWINVALQASTEEMARAINRMVVMSVGYHKNVSALKSFGPMARVAHAVEKNGSIVVLLPTDHVIWSQKAADVLDELEEKHPKLPPGAGLKIWNLGTFSSRAQEEMTKRGWKTHSSTAKQLRFK